MIKEQYNLQIQIFKTLSHPARLAILEILRNGEECVCHMEAILGYRQAYLSQQLAVLREAGLIQDRRDGWNIYYKVIQPGVYEVLDAIYSFTGQTSGAYELTDELCSCPRCSNKKTE